MITPTSTLAIVLVTFAIAAAPAQADPARVAERHAAHEPPRRLSPMFAISGGVATLALAGAQLWPGMAPGSPHDPDARPTSHAAAPRRADLLAGGTIAAGVATVAVALLWTRWRGGAYPTDVSVSSTEGGGTLSFGGKF